LDPSPGIIQKDHEEPVAQTPPRMGIGLFQQGLQHGFGHKLNPVPNHLLGANVLDIHIDGDEGRIFEGTIPEKGFQDGQAMIFGSGFTAPSVLHPGQEFLDERVIDHVKADVGKRGRFLFLEEMTE